MAITTLTQLPPEVRTYFDRMLLTLARPYFIYDLFAPKRQIPLNSGDQMAFRLYCTLSAAPIPLIDGRITAGYQLSVTDFKASINWYGSFVTITDHGKTFNDPATGLSRVFIPAKIEDNPTLFLNDPAYLARLESLPTIEKMRLRHGIWDAFEGQIFTELSQRLHGCEDFEIPPEWERYCVLDWGFAKPFSVGWYAMDYDGVLYRYREYYGCKKEILNDSQGADEGLRMLANDVAKEIADREKGEKIRMRIADPAIWHPRSQARKGEALGVTIHEDFTAQGLYFTKADNDRVHGKMQVHKRLKTEEEFDAKTGEISGEHALFKVFNSCKGFWRTFPALREDEKNPNDVDTDQEDHIYDEVRYMCMARPVRPKKVEKLPVGSFMHERNKLIRAKEYARRHGVSVDVAYGRVR